MDDAALVKRLLVNAQTMEVMSEGAESPYSRAAKNQLDAASRIESLSAVIARVEALESFGAMAELTTLLGPREMVTGAEVEVVSAAQLRAALAERGANDKHE